MLCTPPSTAHRPARKKEVDLQRLLVAEVVELLSSALVDLALQDLRGHVSFEQGAEKRRPIQFRLCRNPQEVARQSRVTPSTPSAT